MEAIALYGEQNLETSFLAAFFIETRMGKHKSGAKVRLDLGNRF